MDGLSSLVALVSTAFNSFKMVVEAVGRAFDKVFPDSRTKIVAAFISSIDDLTKKMALNERVAGAVESVFTTLFNVVKALLGVILPLGVYIERLIPDGIISNAVILLGVVADLVNMFFDLFGVITSSLFNFESLDKGVSGVIGVFTDFYALIESFSFGTIRNNTALKPLALGPYTPRGFGTIRNNTALKQCIEIFEGISVEYHGMDQKTRRSSPLVSFRKTFLWNNHDAARLGYLQRTVVPSLELFLHAFSPSEFLPHLPAQQSGGHKRITSDNTS